MGRLKYLIIFSILLHAFHGYSAEIKFNSSTQYLWYNDILTRDNEKEIAEYLKINVTKLTKDDKLSVYAYGRLNKQLTSGDDLDSRLYYLYLNYEGLLDDKVDISLGRQYVYTNALSGIIDGGALTFKKVGPLGFRFFGGREVLFTERSELSAKDSYLWAASAFSNFKDYYMQLSYAVRYDKNDRSKEIIGFSADGPIVKNLSFYLDTKYDYALKSTNQFLLGLKATPIKDLILKAEYYQSFPSFDYTSIYSVFAVDKYKEYAIKGQYILNKNYSVTLGYAKEDFNGSEEADLYEVGLKAQPLKNLTINASYEKRNGYAGKIDGIRLDGAYKLNDITINAGVDYDDFRRAEREDTAKRYWAGIMYPIKKDISLFAKIEDNISFNYNHNYKGYIALNIKF